MTLERIAAPTSEPISLEEAKAHLRVDTNDEDALIARLIAAAREMAELRTGRAFVTQGWRLWRDAWNGRVLELAKAPLQEVISVTLYSRSGAAAVLSSDAYIVDRTAAPGRIMLKDTAVLPSPLREAAAIAVEFTAGYGAADDVPEAIKAAMLQMIAQLYERRGDGDAPVDALAMLAPFRVMAL